MIGTPVTTTTTPSAFEGHSDVRIARERTRQRRLRRLALLLAPFALLLAVRDLLFGAGALPVPHLPSGLDPYLPGMALLVVLLLVVVGPLVGAGRSPHQLYRPNEIDVHFSDVKGAGPVLEEVERTLDLFRAHAMFADKMGGTPRRAILFEGPPGTGKTHLAKAMAGEAGVPFLFVSASAFQSMFYGQTARKLRSYFKALRRYAREEGGAIGFIEEIDAIGASRSSAGMRGEGISGVVNELLVQLQSFDQPPPGARLTGAIVDWANRFLPEHLLMKKAPARRANVLVIGATNRADDLDPALLRPGRFDRTVTFGLPSRAGRREILEHYLNRKAHEPTLDTDEALDTLAALTMGYSPVMLEHLLDEALVWALRRGGERLSWADLQQAKLTEEIGLPQPTEYAEAERRLIATHEAGHATVAWLVGKGRTLEVLSIVKRKQALGLLVHAESEERFTKTRSELEALLQIAFGGMVAEQLLLGESSSGVASDLKAATTMACQMIGSLGMGRSLISAEAAESATGGNLVAKILGDPTARAEVDELLERSRAAVEELLGANVAILEALRSELLVSEELVGDEILQVIHRALRSSPELA